MVQGQRWLTDLLEGCVDASIEDWQRRKDGAVEVAQTLPHLTLQQEHFASRLSESEAFSQIPWSVSGFAESSKIMRVE